MRILPLFIAGVLVNLSAVVVLAQPPGKRERAASAERGAPSYASGHRLQQKASASGQASTSGDVPRRNDNASRMQSTTGLGTLIAPRLKIDPIPGD
jgi:hypothetical protein